jgi:3-phosphoshikimate 1-carboxyvinyltransferase
MDLSLPDDKSLPPGAPLRVPVVPASKSVTNRALLLAAMAPGLSRLHGGLEAEDTQWMRQALRACGIAIVEQSGVWSIEGGSAPSPNEPLFLGASGTSLRFLLPWLALHADREVQLQGDPRLFERPLGPLQEVLTSLGARLISQAGGLRLSPLPRPPRQLDLDIDASLSSQFVTGLALAAAGLEGVSQLRWSAVASASYLQLTNQWLRRFGSASTLTAHAWEIAGGLHAAEAHLPLDWSGAAAFYAAAAVTGRAMTLGPWDEADAQGDRRLLDILQAAGCHVTTEIRASGQWITLSGPLLRGIHADLTLCPDLGPVLAAVAALSPAPSELQGLETLRLKECDRIEASAELARWLGAEVEVEGDHRMRICPSGRPPEHRPSFDPRNDHRMAFAAAVGGLAHPGTLHHPQCVAKTFPDFWAQWRGMLAC